MNGPGALSKVSFKNAAWLKTALLAVMCAVAGTLLIAQDESALSAGTSEPVAVEAVAPAPVAPVTNRPRLLSECSDIPGLAATFPYSTPDQTDILKFIPMFSMPEIVGEQNTLNIVLSTSVKGSVRFMLKDVTVGEMLEIALAANNLAYEIRGTGSRSIINVMSDDEYRARYGVGFYEQRKVKLIELTYAKPSRVAQMLDGIKSQIGKIIFDDTSGTMVLIDTPSKIAEMEAVIGKSELPTIQHQVPTVTRVFRLQYADLVEVQKEVLASLGKDVGSVTANTLTKTLIVTDLSHNVDKIGDMIAAFDRKPKQVAIQAKIVEVELTDDASMGVNWNQVFEGVRPRFSLQAVTPLSAGVGPTLTYKTIVGGGDLSVVVDALKAIGNTKVISNPYIATRDGAEATIKVVRTQPVKKLSYEPGTTNVVSVTYEYVEIGTVLAVTPVINDDGFVTVDIKPTISDIVDWYDVSPGEGGVVGVPVVKKSEANTVVTVKDNVTIVIGGMIKTENRTSRVGVPLLGSIPIIRHLFSSDVDKTRRTETIVFLTPKIISGEEPFLQIPDEDKSPRFRGSGKVPAEEPVAEVTDMKAEAKPEM